MGVPGPCLRGASEREVKGSTCRTVQGSCLLAFWGGAREHGESDRRPVGWVRPPKTGQNAHVLTDEATRKYIHSFKRLMTYCKEVGENEGWGKK